MSGFVPRVVRNRYAEHRAQSERKTQFKADEVEKVYDEFVAEFAGDESTASELVNDSVSDARSPKRQRVVQEDIADVDVFLQDILREAKSSSLPESRSELIISQLHQSVEDTHIRTLFDAYKPIVHVKFAINSSGGKVALIDFMSPKLAASALEEMQGAQLAGENMLLEWNRVLEDRWHVPSDSLKIHVALPLKHKQTIDTLAQEIASLGVTLNVASSNLGISNEIAETISNTVELDIYLRWRTHAFNQGFSLESWDTTPFQMVTKGPYWFPPDFADSSLLQTPVTPNLIELGDADQAFFQELLQTMTTERRLIKLGMGFALDHADACDDVVGIVAESLTLASTSGIKKLGRLFLLSDILHNSSASDVRNAWAYRTAIEKILPTVFQSLRQTLDLLPGRASAEHFKLRVFRTLNAWASWSVFSKDTLDSLAEAFVPSGNPTPKPTPKPKLQSKEELLVNEAVDGIPLSAYINSKG